MRGFLEFCGVAILAVGAIILASPIVVFAMILIALFALTMAIVAIIGALFGKPVRIVVTKNGEKK